MTDRVALKRSFLDATPWSAAKVVSMTGDASNRRYDRLYLGGDTAILMDAAPERGENVRPFIRIGEHLRTQGFSAPEILARDVENGFLLLEDLGDDRFKEVLEDAPHREKELYRDATDALIALHQCPLLPDLPAYGPQKMVEVCEPVFTSYCLHLTGDVSTEHQTRFNTALFELLTQCTGGPEVLVERDFHAENLLWLPNRDGVARVGMLDYQDAASGHPSYDLVSMLQDARRDVSEEVETAMIAHYIDKTSVDPTAFTTAYWALGLQRNLRIVGVFARLATQMGKPHYVDFIPRVWAHIERALLRPELAKIEPIIRETVPTPTTENLRKLKA
ncbi:phosphotransferase [Epibacterium ulvae]|uniref:aminoglycoside phosphotransferase family protein n=1 Tax=Epibacterium ulvae TaxID=1156985 RepID=UPI001BFC2D47|nr:phosphotransferase [Epibacterium ulvae]MBT8153620.1 phosphotransferase [Epibacterium ulvae]